MLQEFPTPTVDVIKNAVDAWNAAHPNTQDKEDTAK
jgi:hypothetical protein